MSVGARFSSGSADLDGLLEELRAGDNVVFYTPDVQLYEPFVASLLCHAGEGRPRVVYARSVGLLDKLIGRERAVQRLDLATFGQARDPVAALHEEMERIGPGVCYVFEPLHTLAPVLVGEDELTGFFTATCPLLFRLETVCYWDLVRGRHTAADLAAIKDCTQVLMQVEREDRCAVLTPLKVWGRYSEAMFRPHRVLVEGDGLRLDPLTPSRGDAQAYAQALEAKNRELAIIRDALDRSNQELQERNRQLAELNERLTEQGRRYRALHNSMDHLLALFHAGQDISSSLVVDQVRVAIVSATMRLFDASVCRLASSPFSAEACNGIVRGMTPDWERLLSSEAVADAREAVRRELQPRAVTLRDEHGAVLGSVGLAAVAPRGQCQGILEVGVWDQGLQSAESLALLGYLALEASIALDNAQLYREVESQGAQLRYFVEEVIKSEEQDSRRLAFDLHDGLVQMIVAAYQHLQSAQAWHGRDPDQESRELEQGIQMLKRSIYEARRLIARLRPAGLDDFGLVHALRLYVAQLAQDADWEVSLHIDEGFPDLPPALEAALFRIVQEATTNALKYAKTPRLEVDLRGRDGVVIAMVRDWGIGFAPDEMLQEDDRGRRVGLIGMRERARLWGGEFDVRSEVGGGTTVTVQIPVPQDGQLGGVTS